MEAAKAAKAQSPLKAVKSIKQAWLADYRDKLLEYESLATQMEDLKKAIDARSMQLCEYSKRGIAVEKGELTGRIKITSGRRNPKYKEWIEEQHGAETVANILASAPKTADVEKYEVLKRITTG